MSYFQKKVKEIISSVIKDSDVYVNIDNFSNYVFGKILEDAKEFNNFELKRHVLELLKEYILINKDINAERNANNVNLLLKFKNGDIDARDKLLENNHKLIEFFARKHVNIGVEFDDLVQEGSLSFLKGLEFFKPELGYAFSTYMQWWIKKGMLDYIKNDCRTIRIPVHIYAEISKLDRIINEISNEPNPNIILEELGYSHQKLQILEDAKSPIASLNALIGEEGDTELIDFIDSSMPSPEDIVASDYFDEIMNVIENSNLKDVEKTVILMRFGFVDGKIYTLEEVAKVVGFTKQNVNLIENKALQKIRVSNLTRSLACYTDNEDDSLKYLDRIRYFHRAKK